jgi:hypothetical protein
MVQWVESGFETTFTQFDCLSPASADQTHSLTPTQQNFEIKLDDSDSSPSNTRPEQGDGDQGAARVAPLVAADSADPDS